MTASVSIMLLAALAMCAGMFHTASAAPQPQQRERRWSNTCPISYTVTSQWTGGFVGQITLTDSSLFLPRVTFEVTFPVSVHIYGWWNAEMVQPATASGYAVSGTVFRFYKGEWQQGMGFSIDQAYGGPVTPTVSIVDVCGVTTTAAATTTAAPTTAAPTTAAPTTTACPSPPPPPPATCPCNGLRVLKYRASIKSRYAAFNQAGVNVNTGCIDGFTLNTDSTCLGPNPPPSEQLGSAAVQTWEQTTSFQGVDGVNLKMESWMANEDGSLTTGDAQDPVISSYFQLGSTSNGLVCTDMFRLPGTENENTVFRASYDSGEDYSTELATAYHDYFSANQVSVSNSQFCACIADAKVALAETNYIHPTITDSADQSVVTNWNTYLDQLATDNEVSC